MSDTMITDAVGEQLSALMDGELPRDQVRFLLRRVDAEAPLTQRWSRYQLARAVLRRQGSLQLRSDFADALMQRLASEAAPTVARGATLLRWLGGGAIAASVAIVALVVSRPAVQPPTMVAAAPPPIAVPDTRAMPAMPMPTILNLDYAQPASFETSPYGIAPYGSAAPNFNFSHGTPLLVPVPERRQPEAAPTP